MNMINFYNFFSRFRFRGFYFFAYPYKVLVFLIFNSICPLTASIGRKTRFMYGGIGCVIHKNAVIGDCVAIGQGVTIGRSLAQGAPVIGSNVYIGAGARILGSITIGDNVIIGANAVVNCDMPSNCIVAGVPARIVRVIDVSIWDLTGDIL